MGLRQRLIRLWETRFQPFSRTREPNCIAEAFRLRRSFHARRRRSPKTGDRVEARWRRWITPLLRVAVLACWLGVLIWIAVAKPIGPRSVVFLPLGFYGPIVAFIVYYRHRRGVIQTLPNTLSHLLMNAKAFRPAMVDIWMTGAGSRTVIAALLQEARESDWIGAVAALGVLYLALFAVWFAVMGFSLLPGIVLCLASLVLILTLFAALRQRMGWTALYGVARRWKMSLQGSFADLKRALLLLGVASLLVIPAFFILALLIMALQGLAQFLPEALVDAPTEYQLSALFFLVSFLLWRGMNRIDRWNESRIHKLATELEDMYNDYIRRVVLKDTDRGNITGPAKQNPADSSIA